MKDRKIKFRYFTIMEWEKEQDFLRQEGLKGWRFTKATLLGIYHFEEIFCDDESRLEMVKRIFFTRMIPLIAIFFLLVIPNLYTQSSDPSTTGYVLNWAFWILFVLYLFIFLVLGRQFWKYWKNLSK